MWDYTDKVMDHFLHPRNLGEVENADGTGEVGSLACGDALKLTIKIDDDGKIVDAKFKTFGCGSAIASASALTELIKGKTIEEASQITNQDIVDFLGGLPQEKMHCSVMGREALEAAINNFKGITVEAHEELEGRLVCKCFGVSENLIRKVVRENGLRTLEQVTNYCKAGGGCTTCHNDIEDIIHDETKEIIKQKEAAVTAKPKETRPLTNIEKINLIQETINKEIRPPLQMDGGDVELVDVVGDQVFVKLKGSCIGCVSAELTLKSHVEGKLREFVSDTITVEEVSE